MAVIEKPPPTCSRDKFAVVVSRSAGKPASPSCLESAIVKQPAWAAAISSSGFVSTPSPKRERNEYGVWFSTLLGVSSDPWPSLSVPCQTAVAVRFIGASPRVKYVRRDFLCGQRQPAKNWRSGDRGHGPLTSSPRRSGRQ